MQLLEKLSLLEKQAHEFGFKWETAEQIMAQIRSETAEIEVHLQDQNQKKLQEEIGDLMHAVFSLCIFCQFNPEKTLSESVNKFERRFRATQEFAKQEGLTTLNGQSFKKLMELWDKAKQKTD